MKPKDELMAGITDPSKFQHVEFRILEVLIDIRDQLVYFNENVVRAECDNRNGAIRVDVQS